MVEVTDADAANSPRVVNVALTILPIGGAESFIGNGCSAGALAKGVDDAGTGLPYLLLLGMILARCVGRRRSTRRT